jgi:hypothetical protein
MKLKTEETPSNFKRLNDFLAKSREFIIAEYNAEKENFEKRGGNTKEDPVVNKIIIT